MAQVRLDSVSKIFDKNVVAVDKVSLDIENGEFLVLVGPSGCGKSTTLRMIAGLESVSSGAIHIGDNDVTDMAPKDRDIAMVFQNYALYPHMSVYDNMAFGLKLRKYSKEEIDNRVQEAARILDLGELLQRKPKALSGGQRQRVAVGRAIVRKPAAFLFDEPLSNLDAKLRVQMRTEISKLHSQLGSTMIYVTHDQVEAMTMGDRIVVMNDGKVQQAAQPLEIYNQPANLFVAGFIGSPAMNFISGKIVRNDGLVFQSQNFKLSLAKKNVALEKVIDREVLLGIRPEDLIPADENSSDSFRGDIHVTEPMGNEIIFYLKFYDNDLTARCSPDVRLNSDNSFHFQFDMDKIHFFDVESQQRIEPV